MLPIIDSKITYKRNFMLEPDHLGSGPDTSLSCDDQCYVQTSSNVNIPFTEHNECDL